MKATLSVSSTDDRVQKIDTFVKTGMSPDRSTFINTSIDFMIKTQESKRIVDFMYFVSVPILFFLITVGLTLYLASMFFYLLTGISGIYLVLFTFLFYDKYRGVKFGNNRK